MINNFFCSMLEALEVLVTLSSNSLSEYDFYHKLIAWANESCPYSTLEQKNIAKALNNIAYHQISTKLFFVI